jgi:hypothetical protein
VFLKTDIDETEGLTPHRGDEDMNSNDKELIYCRIVRRSSPRDSTFYVPWRDDPNTSLYVKQRNAQLIELEELALESGLRTIERHERDVVERIIMAKRRAVMYKPNPREDIPKEIVYYKRPALFTVMNKEYHAEEPTIMT